MRLITFMLEGKCHDLVMAGLAYERKTIDYTHVSIKNVKSLII